MHPTTTDQEDDSPFSDTTPRSPLFHSDKGWEKQGLFSKDVQQPSNVTRMSRSFRKHCSNRTVQIIYYQAGVGTGTTLSDTITGGVFGTGVAENIREAYSFICANWDDGDEIVLVGFSRGAFTARSVAGMIGALGLLNRKGMECFFPIFTDYENSNISDYDDEFPDKPFGPGVPKPKRGRDSGFQDKYREMLVKVSGWPYRRGSLRCFADQLPCAAWHDAGDGLQDGRAHQGDVRRLLRHGRQPGHPQGRVVAIQAPKQRISQLAPRSPSSIQC